ncbi:hypothetical protein FA13DRAFT_1741291 [Coprinellus micaceus]|uniref:Nephrocystin 3-like N-terminal domain-containing protein n=1 Tax=Coprinellus micaceus TaxID=71717 RepID=A0A4Y7SKH1_COPMI|nr:hypothetical protein FA13DRAFT_1741291 [Coprinellus micaceus]
MGAGIATNRSTIASVAEEGHAPPEQVPQSGSSTFYPEWADGGLTVYGGALNQFGEAKWLDFDMHDGSTNRAVGQGSSSRLSSSCGESVGKTRASPQHSSGVPVTVAHTHDLFSLLDPIPDASHTRDRTISPPNSKCFAGTRKPVLKMIRAWVDSSILLGNPHIMWVYGYAGCGKSAIAQDIAEYFASQNRLAASFFFFRGSGERSKIARFARTIASQVASHTPSAAPIIQNAIDTDPGLLSTGRNSLSAQFQHLIYDPINKVKWDRFASCLRHGPFLIVLDGLDECENHVEITAFIEHMIEYFNGKPRTPLRILVTSRVENHIHERLHSSNQVRLLDLVKQTSDVDISTALDVVIADHKQSWLSHDDKRKLVTHIGGSFIFLTTVIKSLFEPGIEDGLVPMARLSRVLSMNPDFDSLYRSILTQAQDLPHFLDVLSTIALAYEPLSVVQIADLWEIGTIQVVEVLAKIHAIMQVPDDDRTPVTLWHTSLRDFLCSANRAGSFHVSQRRLALRCVSLSTKDRSLRPSSVRTYLRRFHMEHWTKLLQSMDESVDAFNEELGCIMTCLQSVFHSLLAIRFYSQVLKKVVRRALQGSGSIAQVKLQGNGWSMVEAAICVSSYEGIYALAKLGAEMNRQIPDKRTALEFACHAKDWKLAHAVVVAGGDVNVEFRGPDSWEVKFALHAACHHGVKEMVYFLLSKGADPNTFASEQSDDSTDWGYYGFPLAWAADQGDIELVKRLLACGANPNLWGELRWLFWVRSSSLCLSG